VSINCAMRRTSDLTLETMTRLGSLLLIRLDALPHGLWPMRHGVDVACQIWF
jgi:hypothetical protein